MEIVDEQIATGERGELARDPRRTRGAFDVDDRLEVRLLNDEVVEQL